MKNKVREILTSFKEFITTHSYRDTPILTVYVDIDSSNPDNQKQNPAWLIELKNEAKRIADELPAAELKRRDRQETWSGVQETVSRYLLDRKPQGRSMVIFSDLDDYLTVDLPVRLPTKLYYGVPQLKHLLFALDEYKKYLVVLFSGPEVRLIEVFLTTSTEELKIGADHESARRFARKSKTLARERRDSEFEKRYAREVAASINEYFMGDPEFERLILGGNQKQAHAVKSALHPAVDELLVAIEAIDFKLPDNEVARAVKTIANQHEREHDLSVVNDLLSRFHGAGTAVLEQQGVENALRQGRVNTLVIPYPIDSQQFDEIIIDATIHNAAIEFVMGEGADKLNEYGGIGATLHYTAHS